MRDIARIPRFLPRSVDITFTNALVNSRLDYCNSLLKGCYDYNLRRLQGIHNSLCRIVTHTSGFWNITPHLIDLHWLPVCQRIDFKWCLLVFKCLAPYLHSLFLNCKHKSQQPLRQLSYNNLFWPQIHKSKQFFDSSFSVGAPQLWNSNLT